MARSPPSVANPIWTKGESSGQQLLDSSDDLCYWQRFLDNRRRRAFVVDFSVPCVQDERDASRLKLPAKVTTVIA
jgi:hypothetical protein